MLVERNLDQMSLAVSPFEFAKRVTVYIGGFVCSTPYPMFKTVFVRNQNIMGFSARPSKFVCLHSPNSTEYDILSRRYQIF